MEDLKSDETQISSQPKQRKRVTKACTQCNHAHATCDSNRPCKRCTDRGFPDLCKDDFSKKRGKKIKPLEEEPLNYAPILSNPPQTTNLPLTPQFATFEPLINLDESAIMNFVLSSFDMWPVDTSPSQQPSRTPFFNNEPMGGGIEDLADLAKRRIPEKAEELSTVFKIGKQRILSVMKEKNFPISVDTNAYLESRQEELNQVIECHKLVLESNSTPFIIFDRTGKIFFVNKSYKALTGFTYKLPSERGDFYNYVLSPDSLYSYLMEITKYFSVVKDITLVSGFRMKASVRLHSALAEKYIDGILDATNIRDHIGVPLLIVVSFTPTDLPEAVMHKFY